jgi:hypothetical protein
MKALIVDEPWISRILDGSKTWEMRSRSTEHRGRFALIRKGSGQVVGVAELVGCRGPLSLAELRENAARHTIPAERYENGELSKWNVAWELKNAKSLATPVPYQHPSGAVIWVQLSPAETMAVEAAFEGIVIELPDAPVPVQSQSRSASAPTRHAIHPVVRMLAPSFTLSPSTQLPVARDGTCFHPGLIRSGEFTVGDKGDERRYDSFTEALQALRQMSVPRWRRPNDQGNWGIVSGIRWVSAAELGLAP